MESRVVCNKSNYNILIPLKGQANLIYNTLSKGFCLLEKEENDFFNQKDHFLIDLNSSSIINEHLKHLLEQGFIIPEGVSELSIIKDQYNNARNTDEVLMLTIAPTIGCNFACDYCFQEHDNKSGMSIEVQDKICEFIEYFANIKQGVFKHLHICFYGGEPLIKYGIIKSLAKRFIEFCDNRQIHYSSEMVTNGYLLNLERAKTLYDLRLSQLQITIDGTEKAHDARRHMLSKKGTFNQIISNILSYINEVPIFTNIRVNIDKRNVEDVGDLLEYLAAINLNNKENLKVYFAPIESTTSACKGIESFTLEKTEIARSIFKLYVKAVELGLHSVVMPPSMLGICTAARKNGFVIGPTGECHKCFDLITYSKYSIGSIFEYEKLINIDDNNINAKKWEYFSPLKNEICRDCIILPTCAGSCPLKFVHGESVNGESILPCPDWKFNIKEKLIFVAIKNGIISSNYYDQELIKTTPEDLSLSAKHHTIEEMIQYNNIAH